MGTDTFPSRIHGVGLFLEFTNTTTSPTARAAAPFVTILIYLDGPPFDERPRNFTHHDKLLTPKAGRKICRQQPLRQKGSRLSTPGLVSGAWTARLHQWRHATRTRQMPLLPLTRRVPPRTACGARRHLSCVEGRPRFAWPPNTSRVPPRICIIRAA